MSITRAFTTRRVKQSLQAAADAEAMPQRSNTTKGFSSIRNKISGPVELVHTTNMLTYNAPDIVPKSATSVSSTRSDDDMSDALTSGSTPPTSPDVPSGPSRSMSPEPNHLSCYFAAPGQAVPTAKSEAPVIPHRAASHTKKSYESLGRQRSTSRLSEQSHRTVSTKSSFSFSRSSSSSTSTAATSHSSISASHIPKNSVGSIASPPVPTLSAPLAQSRAQPRDYSQLQHPFGPELAQVSEIAEEFGVKDRLNPFEMETKEMAAKGLLKFSAEEYLGEIQSLFSVFFAEPKPAAALWI